MRPISCSGYWPWGHTCSDRNNASVIHKVVQQRSGIAVAAHLGNVERVEWAAIRLVLSHDLEVQGPRGIVGSVDGVEQIPDRVIRIFRRQPVRLRSGQVPDALVRLEMPLHVKGLTGFVHDLECVRTIAIHEPVAIGDSAVREQKRHLMSGFRSQRNEIPHGVGILAVCSRVAFLRVDERREQNWIANEEYRGVVAHQVPVAVLSIELHSKPSGIARSICAATFTPDS